MTEIKHLQKVILSIVKDIDILCKNKGIEYYLLGGSAIGAIRHHGFIPWDDDLDIIMDSVNYEKFIYACKEDLDENKYYLQEGGVDWPCYYSKVRLRGTLFEESTKCTNGEDENGIFVDIFKMENSPSSKVSQLWQYFCAKYLLCYTLMERGWKNARITKKTIIISSFPLKINFLRRYFIRQVEKWNEKETDYLGFFTGRYRRKQSFYDKEIFKKMKYVKFEDTELPVPEGYDRWLKQIFGDYMTPPPAKEQVGLHLKGVDFGVY